MLFIHVPHHAGSVVEAQETPEEQRQEETPEEGIPEGDAEDLPECRDHRPADFERGKPRSILTPTVCKCFLINLMMDVALGYRN